MNRKGEFELIVCESTTGIVLDENLDYCTKSEQSSLFFDSLDEVSVFIEKYKQSDNVFFQVFNSNKELVYEHENSPKLGAKTVKEKRWWQVWK